MYLTGSFPNRSGNICSQHPLPSKSSREVTKEQTANLYHRNFTSAGYSASSVEKYHYPSDCHRRSGGKPDFRSGVLAHTPKRRSHGVPIFGLSSEIMSQVSVYSVFKVHEEAPEWSQELTPSHTLNKGWVLAGCFSKKVKKIFRDPLKTKKPPFRKRKSGTEFKTIYNMKRATYP